MDLIGEYHDRYLDLDLDLGQSHEVNLPRTFRELVLLLLSLQRGYKQLCPGCGCDMGSTWPSQFCSRMCFSGGWR
jgi:hypothetical protein